MEDGAITVNSLQDTQTELITFTVIGLWSAQTSGLGPIVSQVGVVLVVLDSAVPPDGLSPVVDPTAGPEVGLAIGPSQKVDKVAGLAFVVQGNGLHAHSGAV